jgi:hypothetical protein
MERPFSDKRPIGPFAQDSIFDSEDKLYIIITTVVEGEEHGDEIIDVGKDTKIAADIEFSAFKEFGLDVDVEVKHRIVKGSITVETNADKIATKQAEIVRDVVRDHIEWVDKDAGIFITAKESEVPLNISDQI